MIYVFNKKQESVNFQICCSSKATLCWLLHCVLCWTVTLSVFALHIDVANVLHLRSSSNKTSNWANSEKHCAVLAKLSQLYLELRLHINPKKALRESTPLCKGFLFTFLKHHQNLENKIQSDNHVDNLNKLNSGNIRWIICWRLSDICRICVHSFFTHFGSSLVFSVLAKNVSNVRCESERPKNLQM